MFQKWILKKKLDEQKVNTDVKSGSSHSEYTLRITGLESSLNEANSLISALHNENDELKSHIETYEIKIKELTDLLEAAKTGHGGEHKEGHSHQEGEGHCHEGHTHKEGETEHHEGHTHKEGETEDHVEVHTHHEEPKDVWYE